MIQLYQPMDLLGTPVLNEYDCPLYTITDVFHTVPSGCISHTVSVLHECTDSCVFKRVDVQTHVERETVTSHKLVFDHDFCNNIYSRNISILNNELFHYSLL